MRGGEFMRHVISSNINYSRRIGYCNNYMHRGYITKESLGEHKCLERGCPHFKRFKNANFWKDYYVKERKRQLRKYYIKHQGSFRCMNIECFLKYVYNFYGSYLKVPMEEGKIQIEDLLKSLQKRGNYVIRKEA